MKRIMARQKAVDVNEISQAQTKEVTGGLSFWNLPEFPYSPIARMPGVENPIGIVTFGINECEQCENPPF